MKKFLLSVSIFILLITTIDAQTIVYQATFGSAGNDNGFAAIRTADGGYAMAGHSSSYGAGDYDVVLIKTDSIANLQWTKRYGGTGDEQAIKVIQCTDGGYAISGMTQSFGAGGWDALLIKTDAAGTLQFMKTFGGASDDRFLNVRQTSDSGYILAGSTTNFGFGGWDMLYVKTDANGDTLWTKIMGGADFDQGTDAIETADSGFALTGRASSWGAGYSDIFLGKTNSTGDTLWTRAFGTGGFDEGMKLKQTFDNGFIITGATNGLTTGGYEVYLNKIDSAGNLTWSKAYGGLFTEASYDVLQLEDSGYAVAGITESFGSNHLKSAHTNNNALAQQAVSNNLKVMGNENTNFFLVRTDVNGDTLWSYAYGGPSQDEGFALALAADKGFVISGYSRSFNPDSIDYYLVKTDSNGYSGCNEVPANPVVSSPATIVSATTAQVNTGLIVTTVSAAAPGLTTVTQTTLCYAVLTGISQLKQSSNNLFAYPNPCSAYTTLHIPGQLSNSHQMQIVIYDVMCRVAKQLTATHDVLIDTHDLAAGIYQVNLQSENVREVFTAKIVVE